MKKLFKYFCVCLAFVNILTILSGCRAAYYYSYDDLKSEVIKVEVIKIDDLGRNQVLLRELSGKEIDMMLIELAQIRFSYPFGDPLEVHGFCFKIYYRSLKYEIIGQMGTKRFDEDNRSVAWYKRRCSVADFKTLISKFVDIE